MKQTLPINRFAVAMAATLMASTGAFAALPVSAYKAKAAAAPMKVTPAVVNSSVKIDTIINENFAKWTKGSLEAPDPELVTDEMAPELMNYQGNWTFFRMQEAGGNGYMGFDYVGDDGPGYIKTPGVNFLNEDGSRGIYRFTCHVMNGNENSQDQALQAFVMDEANSAILQASTQPMEYKGWTECTWIGHTTSPSASLMAFGWQGEVFIDHLVAEKLIYPLATPDVLDAALDDDGTAILIWDKVEGATSYSIQVYNTFGEEPVASAEVGDVDECKIDFSGVVSYKDDFIFYVTAKDGEKISYPGYCVKSLVPDEVGAPTALPATNVSADGFTANWAKGKFATNYVVMPEVKHTAQEAEQYYILNEDFHNVPEESDEYSGIMICPLMGYGGTDIYFSRAGWTVDMGMMVRLMPDMPIFALSNQLAMYGLPGSLTSPVTDFSVGGGKVTVTGMGMSMEDDIVLACELVDANGEAYASEEFELTTLGDMFDITLEGGQADSRLVIKIIEAGSDEDAAAFTNIAVSVNLESGETIKVPAETVHAANVTSAEVKCPVDQYNEYSYAVMGYISAPLMESQISDYVTVDKGSAVKALTDGNAKAYISRGVLNVANPSADKCDIYTLDGKLVASSFAKNLSVEVEKGVYIVKIANKSFKVAY